MADKKISELTALTGANVADTDLLPIVDTSATETKKITFGEFKSALDTATGFVRITGDTMTGNLSFGDNNKAIFGAGSDLEIYHDGSNSYVSEVGTGDLRLGAANIRIGDNITGASYIYATQNAEVTLYHNNSPKLATTATGIDVTGTVTADGLTVDGAATVSQNMTNGSSAAFTDPHLALKATNSVDTTGFVGMSFATSDNANYGFSLGAVRSSGGVGDLVFRNHYNSAQGTKKLNIATNGDISFYEDTGTTAKFFWDASAESLGIGTSSPSLPLHVNSTTSGLPVTSGTTQTNGVFRLSSSATSGIIDFGMNGSNPWIQATDYTGLNNNYNLLLNPNGGNVGIGTSSLAGLKLVALGATGYPATSGTTQTGVLRLTGGTGLYNVLDMGVNESTDTAWIQATRANSLGTYDSLVINPYGGNVGIGTSSPSALLHVEAADGAAGGAIKYTSTAVASGYMSADGAGLCLATDTAGITFRTGVTGNDPTDTGSERMRIDSSGNVGIGVVPSTIWSSSYDALQIGLGGSVYAHGGAGSNMHMAANIVYEGIAPNYYDKYLTSSTASKYAQDSGLHIWSTAASGTAGNAITWSEAMRIDSSGNLLVGTTSTTPAVSNDSDGIALQANGTVQFSANNTTTAIINRKSTDGTILQFRKDGTTVGSIGVAGGDLYISGGSSHAGIRFDTNILTPAVNGTQTDATVDLGYSSYRYKDLYLSGGVVFNVAGGTGTSTSGTLDDYEEGAWVPTISFDDAAVSLAYGVRYAHYTKVGNVVHLSCYVSLTNKGSSVGSAKVGGLPFAAINATGNYQATTFWAAQVSCSGFLQAYIPLAQSYVILQELTTGGTNSNLTNADFANNSEVMINVSYATSS
jgi:hypothetical protein